MTNTSKMKYQIKATKEDGEVYYIYDGMLYDYDRAVHECADCNKFWPHIKYEVVEHAE